MSRRASVVCRVAFVALAAATAAAQTPAGTAFSYQGRLADAGGAANGPYDLRLVLYDAPVGGAQVGPVVTRDDVVVTNGLFTVPVDFGPSAFAGSARWLELAVRPGASTGAYTVLSPRQELTPAPHASFSQGTPWTGISGKPAGFADDIDNDSGGDITDVTPGPGLTGGGSAGPVTLSVAFGGSGMATSVSHADHDHFGASWTGSTTSGLAVSNAVPFGQALFGTATSATGVAYGVRGEISGTGGAGVLGAASATGGTTYGVRGTSASTDGTGVYGHTSATSGAIQGVFGETTSTAGNGVFGRSAATDGLSIGVRGHSASTAGRGVYGFAFATTGTASGVYGQAASAAGFGGAFTNTAGGTALRLIAGGLMFADGTTQATAPANPAADITGVAASTGLTGGGTSGDVSLAVSFAGTGAAATVSRSDHDHFGASWSGTAPSGLLVTNATAAGPAIQGSSTSTDGATYGVRGTSSSTAGSGVFGTSSATSGFSLGVRGESSSIAGAGVLGRANSADGASIGVRGDSFSTLGYGVFGFAAATSGTGSGVYGIAASPAGYGGTFQNNGGGAALRLTTGALMFADGTTQATAPVNTDADITGVAAGTGLTGGGVTGNVTLAASFGGTGGAATVSHSDHDHYGASWGGATANGLTVTTTNGAAGRAIYGEATATAGVNWGVWGQTGSSEGRAMYGRATSSLGNNYGVFGETASATGTAVYGLSTRTTGVNYGVRGETASNQGRGVYGLATAATGTTYGVYGESSTFDGAGVQGVGQQYGVVGQTTSSTGFGFYTTTRGSFGAINVTGSVGGLTPSFLESDDVPVVFVNRRGSDGTLVNFGRSNLIVGNISVAAGVVSYNAFTGSHYAWTDEPVESGLLVSLTGRNLRFHDREDGEPIYGVAPSDRVNDPRVLGAYSGRLEPNAPDDPATSNPHLVAAVGNGEVWVIDTGEDIEPGDRLISSGVRGHARKDDDAFATSYVVGRAAEAVRWAEVGETVDGVRHRLVSILFEPSVVEKQAPLRRQLAAVVDVVRRLQERLAALEAERP